MSPNQQSAKPAYPTILQSVIDQIESIFREHPSIGVDMTNNISLEFNVGYYRASAEPGEIPAQIIIATSVPAETPSDQRVSVISVRGGPDVQIIHIANGAATNAMSGEVFESEMLDRLKKLLSATDFNDKRGLVKLSERMAAGTYQDWMHAMFDIF